MSIESDMYRDMLAFQRERDHAIPDATDGYPTYAYKSYVTECAECKAVDTYRADFGKFVVFGTPPFYKFMCHCRHCGKVTEMRLIQRVN